MAAPPISTKSASFAFRLLFPADKIEVRHDSSGNSVYFNDETSPRYHGPDWNLLYDLAMSDALLLRSSQQTVQ